MPKITRGGGASHAEEIPDVVEVPQASGPDLPTDDGTDSSPDTEPALTAGDEPAASEDLAVEADTAADTGETEPAAKPRARRRTVAGATSVEGS